jgi:hypothetical protein
MTDWWTGVENAIARALTIPEGGIDTIIAEGVAVEQKLIDGAKEVAQWFVSDEPTIVADAQALLAAAATLTSAGFSIPGGAAIVNAVTEGVKLAETLFGVIEAAETPSAAQSIASVLQGTTPSQVLKMYETKNKLRSDTNALRVAISQATK